MKKVLLTAFIAGLSFLAMESSAQTQRDERGEYHYETHQQRVWIPERRTGGVFGIGSKTVPGHYETRATQVKIYHDRYGNPAKGRYDRQGRGWEGKHPHGMPPGQRKKQSDHGYNSRIYDRNSDGVIDARDRAGDGGYDRNGDGVVDTRDRNYDRNGDGVINSRDYTRDHRNDNDDRSHKRNKHDKRHKDNKSRGNKF